MSLEKKFREWGLNVPSKKSVGYKGRMIWVIPNVTRNKFQRIFELDEAPDFVCFYGGESIDHGLRIRNLGSAFYTLYRVTNDGVFEIIKNPSTGKKNFHTDREHFDTPGRVYTKKI